MRIISVSLTNVLCRAFPIGWIAGFLLLCSTVARACPYFAPEGNRGRDFAWVELNSFPSSTPMDLVSFYDRTSGLQFVAWAGLLVFALAGIAMVVERSVRFSRESTNPAVHVASE